MRTLLLSLLLFGCASTPMLGCASTQSAVRKDPMKCERDPKCAEKMRANDCSTQCSDDPACVDRCEQVNQSGGQGALGH
jgi:hypothetical protein